MFLWGFFVIIWIPENVACAYFAVVNCTLVRNVWGQWEQVCLQTKCGDRHCLPLAVLKKKKKNRCGIATPSVKASTYGSPLIHCYVLLILYFPVTGEAHVEQSSAGLRFTFIAVGGLVMLSTRRSMNDHRVRARLRLLPWLFLSAACVCCVVCVSCV